MKNEWNSVKVVQLRKENAEQYGSSVFSENNDYSEKSFVQLIIWFLVVGVHYSKNKINKIIVFCSHL